MLGTNCGLFWLCWGGLRRETVSWVLVVIMEGRYIFVVWKKEGSAKVGLERRVGGRVSKSSIERSTSLMWVACDGSILF